MHVLGCAAGSSFTLRSRQVLKASWWFDSRSIPAMMLCEVKIKVCREN